MATSAGHVLSSGNPLNSATNAVRYVFGARSVGDLELARITFKVTDVAAFTAAIQNNTFCADGTGGDHDKDGRGAQDSIWRYYEGNNHTCFEGAPAASLTKVPEYVNGSASSDVVPLSSVIGYKMTFANTSGATLYDIRLIDTPLTNLTLVEATTPTCPYANYNGNKAGLPTFISIGDGTQATWNSLATLAAGESVTVHMCGVVNGSASDGEEVRNQIKALYKESVDGEDKELIAKTLQLVVDGPLAVSLSRFEAERTGEIVHLQWETATETANAGFNLYVETGDGLELLNETLIPSTVIDSVAPTFYSYEARSDGDLFHIEMVSIHGRAETFGPFAAVESGAAPQINLDKALWIPMVVQ